MTTDPTSDKTPLAIADQQRSERSSDLTIGPTDGPIVQLLKLVARCPVASWPVDWFVRQCLNYRRRGAESMPPGDAKEHFRAAVEWYWLFWTAILFLCYGAIVWAVRGGFDSQYSRWVTLAIVLPFALALMRLYEILATAIWLHFINRYRTGNLAHALSVTFLAFFQVALAFSILYCGVAYWSNDFFGNTCGGLTAGWIDPFYFSIFTLGTLGFGDLKPESQGGRLLVVCELSFGLLLLVVAFQRVLANVK
ncbi:MAG: potassium channel family protein [Pirellulales bacterium]